MIKDRKEITAQLKRVAKIGDFGIVCDATDEIEQLVENARAEAIGWMYAYSCIRSNEGKDIRKDELPLIFEKFKKDLE